MSRRNRTAYSRQKQREKQRRRRQKVRMGISETVTQRLLGYPPRIFVVHANYSGLGACGISPAEAMLRGETIWKVGIPIERITCPACLDIINS